MEPRQKTPGPPPGRQKMNYACEACRAAKTKCQPGLQPDICKRCSEFKRECIFRTGPRTRRPKASLRVDSSAAALPPPPGPSKTFSIDFEVPAAAAAEEEPGDAFDALRRQHERILDDLALHEAGEDDEDEQQQQQQVIEDVPASDGQREHNNNDNNNNNAFSFNDMTSSPSVSRSGTGSSGPAPVSSSSMGPGSKTTATTTTMMNLGIKPQFNLDSANRLLASFRAMLPSLPCVVLPAGADVRSLARSSPFVLLAILAATSCSGSLQGHSLYDEEFRKVLGLKFVAGGERSLELLQGILIYCAWYPFHLRPKNKQSFQYIRMAVDIVHDLEMEQEPDLDLFAIPPDQHARKLDNLRALLGCFYAMSAFSSTWGKVRSTLPYSPQLARCAEALERHGALEQDRHLVWLVRLQYVSEELVEAQRAFDRGPRDHQSEMQRNLIRAGLEAQFHDFRKRMPEPYASMTSIFLQLQVTEAFLLAPALLRMPRRPGSAKDDDPAAAGVEAAAAARLLLAAQCVRAVLDHVARLPPRAFGGLSGADYGRFIIAVIIAYRLSFPMLRVCRDHDVAAARRVLELGEMLRRVIEAPGGNDDDGGGDDEETLPLPGDANSRAKGKGTAQAQGGIKKKPRRSDAVSALKIVLRSVRTKFEEKSAALDAVPSAAAAAATANLRSMCPMLNGSLNQYIPLWAGQPTQPQPQPQQLGFASYATTSQTSSGSGLTTDALSSGLGVVDPGTPFAATAAGLELSGAGGNGDGIGLFGDKPLLYHDLWATMTMGWTGDMGEVNMEDIGNTGYDEMLDQF
ncbi:putative zn 2cys6 transcription factor [Rosellinia necatrix]|uniref:Putative zn 2cys6 transcription factor n=1 Tax=Rosellinia necatrix TaxID=77044 RepID=A0A1W2TGA9_ROSNE|nr:putative zn 2cys6 transcription factor [Rosellinia necatrix]